MFLRNEGFCCICDAPTTFVARHPWLRDHYLRERCGTIPHARAVVEVLHSIAPDWELAIMHEGSPSTNHIARRCPNYSYSFFYRDVPLGGQKNGQRCENLGAMTFKDDSFDVFITQDVLEDVFRPDRALSEIMRVLRPGGIHVFTAPKHKHLLSTVQRATVAADGAITHLLPPEYHAIRLTTPEAWSFGTTGPISAT